MNYLFKGKITKKGIEQLMGDLLDNPKYEGAEWTASPYVEEGIKLTLYYFDGLHIGTWQKSGGCVFDWTTADIAKSKSLK